MPKNVDLLIDFVISVLYNILWRKNNDKLFQPPSQKNEILIWLECIYLLLK